MAMRTTAGVLSAVMALLLVLVGLVAADAQVANLADPRSLATSGIDTECSTEASACTEDESCIDCLSSLGSGLSSCSTEGVDSCGDAADYYCCAIAAEDSDCLDNQTFSIYLECAFGVGLSEYGCDSGDFDLSDCNGANGLASSWGVSFLASFGAVAVFMVASVGFVV